MCSLQTQTTIVIEYAPFSFVIERHRSGVRQCKKKIKLIFLIVQAAKGLQCTLDGKCPYRQNWNGVYGRASMI